ncbi:MAG: gamma-glutamyl-gamma-aminobutyrate hydrolase family protein, partial [Akkermansiaceae bacterium]|nr:gamma-glutamyl-gamma-aminobutyrate hydrolase family protein [Akkermansiaceae bacterium]
LPALLELAAGILLPGTPSNVHPSHFGEEVLDATLPLDPARDALTLPTAPGFYLGVQWHPAWLASGNPVSIGIGLLLGPLLYADHRRSIPRGALFLSLLIGHSVFHQVLDAACADPSNEVRGCYIG